MGPPYLVSVLPLYRKVCEPLPSQTRVVHLESGLSSSKQRSIQGHCHIALTIPLIGQYLGSCWNFQPFQARSGSQISMESYWILQDCSGTPSQRTRSFEKFQTCICCVRDALEERHTSICRQTTRAALVGWPTLQTQSRGMQREEVCCSTPTL